MQQSAGGSKQAAADRLDAAMRQALLPSEARVRLGAWAADKGAAFAGAAGTGMHGVGCVPAHWAGIGPWPEVLGVRGATGTVAVSRAQVREAVGSALDGGRWDEALVVPYVWGRGNRPWRGPVVLAGILAHPGTAGALAGAVQALTSEGAVAAYRRLDGAVPGLGPAFFTKFLHFAGLALVEAVPGPLPLILDSRVAAALRALAVPVGLAAGLPDTAEIARWTWSDGGWTPHRYRVYLEWMHAAAEQLASTCPDWPARRPDLLELALFKGV
ncbi:hypothetical protein AB0442_26205 [Kitasatospora sp. NPDC085895]|uniref:8-oxoguanine DNA glycosylase OGG fold protein n=1 Tax=Kitasatospora sp. NPDC085895 TaxID=3155057 RepID=UPI00344BE69E